MSLRVDNVKPAMFSVASAVSSSKYIQKKDLIEMYFEDQGTFTPTRNIMRINITSPQAFLSCPESFFRWTVKFTGDASIPTSLDEGGLFALIRRIRVIQKSPTLVIQDLDHFNYWYALQSNLKHPRNEVDQQHGMFYDALTPFNKSLPHEGGGYDVLSGSAFSVNSSGVLTATSSDFISQLRQGDLLLMKTSETVTGPESSGLYTSVVTAVADSGTATIVPAPSDPIDFSAIYVVHNGFQVSPRAAACDGNTFDCVFKLPIAIFEQIIPLPFMHSGIIFEFELAPAIEAFHTRSTYANVVTGVGATPYDYEVSEARFFGMMYSLHADIVEGYRAMYNSEVGIIFHLPTYHIIDINDGMSAETSKQVVVGIRSVRKIYMTQHDSEHITGSSNYALESHTRSLSQYLGDGVTQYQVRVGSTYYPRRPVIVSSSNQNNKAEAYHHIMMVANGNAFMERRLNFQDFSQDKIIGDVDSEGNYVAVSDTDKFIMGIDFAMDPNEVTGVLTGRDLTQPIDIMISRSASHFYNGDRVLRLTAEYDLFYKLSRSFVGIIQ